MNNNERELDAFDIPPYRLPIVQSPSPRHREYERVAPSESAFAFDAQGHELGRIANISGGGLLLDPASPWARVALTQGQQLAITIVEPTSGNRTEMNVEVCRIIQPRGLGLRFL